MNKILIACCVSVLFAASCVSSRTNEVKTENKAPEKSAANANADAPKEAAKNLNTNASEDIAEAIPTSKSECLSVDTGDNAVVKNQTFPIDFPPFTKSCFVTSHNPEYDDPPLESEFSIYKNGKKIFEFPDRFNGVQFGCWVEAVSFEDLNDDALKDVIVVGKCSAKSAPYNENMVYVNTGREFTTDENANYKLADFKKIKEISNFVRQNPENFFK